MTAFGKVNEALYHPGPTQEFLIPFSNKGNQGSLEKRLMPAPRQ